MKLIREFWPHIQVAAALGFVAFLLACDQHDNGIPNNPTPDQQARAAELSEEGIQLLCSVVDAFHEFCETPDDEEAGVKALIDAHKQSQQFFDKIKDDVCQYVSYPGIECDRARLADIVDRLEEATDRMAAEVWRRRDDPDFEIDQARYDRTREVINVKSPDPTYVNFCNPSVCFWCKWKHYFHFDR